MKFVDQAGLLYLLGVGFQLRKSYSYDMIILTNSS
jgi:hypothetical protein